MTGQSGLQKPFWLLPAGAVGCFVHRGHESLCVRLELHIIVVPFISPEAIQTRKHMKREVNANNSADCSCWTGTRGGRAAITRHPNFTRLADSKVQVLPSLCNDHCAGQGPLQTSGTIVSKAGTVNMYAAVLCPSLSLTPCLC